VAALLALLYGYAPQSPVVIGGAIGGALLGGALVSLKCLRLRRCQSRYLMAYWANEQPSLADRWRNGLQSLRGHAGATGWRDPVLLGHISGLARKNLPVMAERVVPLLGFSLPLALPSQYRDPRDQRAVRILLYFLIVVWLVMWLVSIVFAPHPAARGHRPAPARAVGMR